MTTLALAGDAMLGRGVGERLRSHPARSLFSEELLEVVARADGMILNLECCISGRGEPFPGRVFHFRAPPAAIHVLHLLGVRAVTLANNHALDYGTDALTDTLDLLDEAGIVVAGAGRSVDEARSSRALTIDDRTFALVACTDHPAEYAADETRPGVAWADLSTRIPGWLDDEVRRAHELGAFVLVSPHWGPNMIDRPLAYVRRAAADLLSAGADLVAGHSAHVFHGFAGHVLFDLGDFVDDYAVGPLRNDLGLLWLVTIDDDGLRRVAAVPLRLGFCRTDVAHGDEARWIRARLGQACRDLGSTVTESDGILTITPTPP